MKKFVSNLLSRSSFRRQLIVAFSVGIVLTSVVSSLAVSTLSSRAVRERLVQEGHQSVETFASQSVLALLYHSGENARDYAEAVLAYPDVLGTAIYDVDGSTVLSLGDGLSFPPEAALPVDQSVLVRETDDSWQFAAPVYTSSSASLQDGGSPFAAQATKPELLGYVQIAIGKGTLNKLTNEIVRSNLIVSSSLAAALLIILLFITKHLIRPLNELAETMRRAETGEDNVRATLSGSKDVIRMGKVFNKMMAVLDAREMQLKEARDAALHAAHLKGEFAANVSHEIRTPLNGVLGMLELLQDMGLEPKQAQYVKVARNSGESLLALINDLLDFSRNEAGKLEIRRQPVDLRELIDGVIGLVSVQAGDKRLDIGYTVDSRIPGMVDIDPDRIRQILINLVGNAIKFTDAGEVGIYVRLTEGEDQAHSLYFEVKDTGIGIPDEAQQRIFEPFLQGDGSTTRRFGGTGLGLAICRQLVTLMGGGIGVQSVSGSGSTFHFTIPVQAVETEETAGASREQTLSGLRVLLIAGGRIIREQFSQLLADWGAHCHTLPSPDLADEVLKNASQERRPVDVLILDEGVPDGLSVATSLRQAKANSPLYDHLVLLTRHGLPEKTLESATISAYVDKPIRAAELHDCLSALRSPKYTAFGETKDVPANIREGAGTYKILVVEDNRSNQIVASGMLERLGFLCSIASSGDEALSILRHDTIDLVLMDCNMPGMDGYQTTARVRTGEVLNNHVPIIAMTANAQQGDEGRCIAAGMDDYLTKPLNLRLLHEKLVKWLPGYKPLDANRPDPSVISYVAERDDSAVTLDTETFEELRATIGNAFNTMIMVFLEDIPRYIDELRDGVDRNDARAIADAAHVIKSSCLNFGARRLGNLCKSLEARARHDDISNTRKIFADLLAETEQLVTRLRHEIRDVDKQTRRAKTSDAHVLIVDDDRTTRFVIRNVMEDAGHYVLEARNGEEALKIFNEQLPDLILMDANMPVMDGFATCHQVRKHPEGSQIPILIITGLDDEHSIERAFAVGATDYIPKPVNIAVLGKRVERLLEASRAEKHMRHLAFVDPLTGLPNRTQFTNRLRELLEVRERGNARALAILFIDVDRFKLINDTLGHDAGDMLLKVVAERLRGCTRGDDIVARLGGDEFTVILDSAETVEDVAIVAGKICGTFNNAIRFLDQEIFVTVSVGIAMYPVDGEDIATLMKRADTAMFQAKKNRNEFRFYEPSMESAVSWRLEMETDLRRALERDELVVHYQPQMDLTSGKIVGMEALVRWEHPERGLVPPNDFIPLAEETGLIEAVGEWVLGAACRQLQAWLRMGLGPLRMSVNISGRQLDKKNLAEVVAMILNTTGLPPDMLELEITESAIMDKPDQVLLILQQLKDMGILIAIDDFGTGYSSLAYLKRFPIDILKIDRSFVRDLPDNAEDVAIITGVIALGKSLNLLLVAEGVETEAQKALLAEQGCDMMQGYLLSKPLPASMFEQKFLRASRPKGADKDSKVTVLRKSDGQDSR